MDAWINYSSITEILMELKAENNREIQILSTHGDSEQILVIYIDKISQKNQILSPMLTALRLVV